MTRQATPFFTNTVTASPTTSAEVVIATLNGCSVTYPSDSFLLTAVADITVEASVTGVTLNIRRTSLTGTVVATSVTTPKAAADIVRQPFPVIGTDRPGDVTGMTYVLTATMTAAGGASTVNNVGLTASLTS